MPPRGLPPAAPRTSARCRCFSSCCADFCLAFSSRASGSLALALSLRPPPGSMAATSARGAAPIGSSALGCSRLAAWGGRSAAPPGGGRPRSAASSPPRPPAASSRPRACCAGLGCGPCAQTRLAVSQGRAAAARAGPGAGRREAEPEGSVPRREASQALVVAEVQALRGGQRLGPCAARVRVQLLEQLGEGGPVRRFPPPAAPHDPVPAGEQRRVCPLRPGGTWRSAGPGQTLRPCRLKRPGVIFKEDVNLNTVGAELAALSSDSFQALSRPRCPLGWELESGWVSGALGIYYCPALFRKPGDKVSDFDNTF